MPELPEVETVRRMMRRELQGHKIVKVVAVPDLLVQSGTPSEAFLEALQGSTVLDVGRKGKIWWLELDRKPWLFGHLGMSGWIESYASGAPEPRFSKLILESTGGRGIALTDPRRLGRIWLGDGPENQKKIQKLGFDSLDELPSASSLEELLTKRKIPIKALLLDQSVFAGIGNYLADEVLFQSRIAPARLASSLSLDEVKKLRAAIQKILKTAVEAEADENRFPKSWLFHQRWGGSRGSQMIDGHAIVRETIGGRTTAWVPDLQS